MIKELSITVALIAGAIAAFFLYRRRNQKFVFSEETIDGELKMVNVVDFFRSFDIKQERDIPFIAKGDCDEYRKMFGGPFPNKKEGYITIFLGVFNNERQSIIEHKLIHAKSIDSEIQQVLSDEILVVLQ